MMSKLETGPQYPGEEGSKISGDPAEEVVGQGLLGGPITGPSNTEVTEQADVLDSTTALTQTIPDSGDSAEMVDGQGLHGGPITGPANTTVTEQADVLDSTTALTQTIPDSGDPAEVVDGQGLHGDPITGPCNAAVTEHADVLDPIQTIPNSGDPAEVIDGQGGPEHDIDTLNNDTTLLVTMNKSRPCPWYLCNQGSKMPAKANEQNLSSGQSTIPSNEVEQVVRVDSVASLKINELEAGPQYVEQTNLIGSHDASISTMNTSETSSSCPTKEVSKPETPAMENLPFVSAVKRLPEIRVIPEKRLQYNTNENANTSNRSVMESADLTTQAPSPIQSDYNLWLKKMIDARYIKPGEIPPSLNDDVNVFNSKRQKQRIAPLAPMLVSEVLPAVVSGFIADSSSTLFSSGASLESRAHLDYDGISRASQTSTAMPSVTNEANYLNELARFRRHKRERSRAKKREMAAPALINSLTSSNTTTSTQANDISSRNVISSPGTSKNNRSVPPAPSFKRIAAPGSTNADSKKPKPNDVASVQRLEMALIDSAHPEGKIPQSYFLKVEDAILALLDAHMDIEGAPKIKFNSSSWRNQIYRISCADQAARDFLEKAVLEMTPPYSNAKLMAVHKDRIPRFVCGTVTVPGRNVPTERILKRIKNQNEGLNTEKWIVQRVEEKDDATELAIKLNISSAGRIRRLKNTVYYGYGQIKFTLDWTTDTGASQLIIEID